MKLGTPIVGIEAVAEAGMGIQYYFAPLEVSQLSMAYSEVSIDRLSAAINKVAPEFAHDYRYGTRPIGQWVPAKFERVRSEIAKVANANLAMIAGMF